MALLILQDIVRYRFLEPTTPEFFWLQNNENGRASIRLLKSLTETNQVQHNVSVHRNLTCKMWYVTQ